MHIEQEYFTDSAKHLVENHPCAKMAYLEIKESICNMIGDINNQKKNCNGVVPIKEGCYKTLEEKYGWYREKPLSILVKQGKGGPIDVYKEFNYESGTFCVGLEFETGNISSAHRSMNKLNLGIIVGELQLAVLMMPMHELSYFLTDRVANYEELRPYFSLVSQVPFIIIGFNAENFGEEYQFLSKGKDGMSDRAIHKWKER